MNVNLFLKDSVKKSDVKNGLNPIKERWAKSLYYPLQEKQQWNINCKLIGTFFIQTLSTVGK